ncbi:hypothetical protein HYX06_02465 [Candidatus Woesearchaeota archaeon]|nr:hypothetical protein [Candidatus Woesearchaeota archaeon]
MENAILIENDKFVKEEFKVEDDIVNLFSKNYKKIISDKSYLLLVEKQFKSKNFKNFKHSISDGFLLAWENPTTPSLYITEFELISHPINTHILPQLGDFISFIQSADKEELKSIRDYFYNEIKKDKTLFEKLQTDTKQEVHHLLENSMEDLQILLVIDKINPELSIGLSQIEKAIKVKIRKIEISKFANQKEGVILFADSEKYKNEKEEQIKEAEEYSIEYHTENKTDNVKGILNELLDYTESHTLQCSPMKHYIGFYNQKGMIISCVTRKSSVVFYSKAKINEIKIDDIHLSFRDVRNIGHYTNHLPTEIVVENYEALNEFFKYLDRLLTKYK